MTATSITYPLTHPLLAEGIDTVTIRTIGGEDLGALAEIARAGGTIGVSHLLARLADLSFDVFALLSGEDVAAITDRVESAWDINLIETAMRLAVVYRSATPEPGAAVDPVSPVISRGDHGARRYTLVFPFKVDGKWLRTVMVRLPEQGDVDDFADGVLKNCRDMALRLTGLHPAVFKGLKWQDSEVIHLMMQDLLPEFLTEGKAR